MIRTEKSYLQTGETKSNVSLIPADESLISTPEGEELLPLPDDILRTLANYVCCNSFTFGRLLLTSKEWKLKSLIALDHVEIGAPHAVSSHRGLPAHCLAGAKPRSVRIVQWPKRQDVSGISALKGIIQAASTLTVMSYPRDGPLDVLTQFDVSNIVDLDYHVDAQIPQSWWKQLCSKLEMLTALMTPLLMRSIEDHLGPNRLRRLKLYFGSGTKTSSLGSVTDSLKKLVSLQQLFFEGLPEELDAVLQRLTRKEKCNLAFELDQVGALLPPQLSSLDSVFILHPAVQNRSTEAITIRARLFCNASSEEHWCALANERNDRPNLVRFLEEQPDTPPSPTCERKLAFLLENGASPLSHVAHRTSSGKVKLTNALFACMQLGDVELMKLLLDAIDWPNVETRQLRDSEGFTPLHFPSVSQEMWLIVRAKIVKVFPSVLGDDSNIAHHTPAAALVTSPFALDLKFFTQVYSLDQSAATKNHDIIQPLLRCFQTWNPTMELDDSLTRTLAMLIGDIFEKEMAALHRERQINSFSAADFGFYPDETLWEYRILSMILLFIPGLFKIVSSCASSTQRVYSLQRVFEHAGQSKQAQNDIKALFENAGCLREEVNRVVMSK